MKDRNKKEAKKKLAIIVPYRNRESHLNIFVPYIEEYLGDKFEYKIFVIEQKDNKPFNRGKLLTAVFKESGSDFDYYCFHDVDMLPIDADYSYCEQPTHLANTVDGEQSFYNYFGGVTILSKLDFKIINGYSNEYWGWGFEDDDLLQRCIQCNLSLDTRAFGIEDETYNLNYFYFNGVDSFISIPFENYEMRINQVQYENWVFPIFTFDDLNLREIHLDYIAEKRTQSEGRSRLVNYGRVVFTINKIPNPQTTEIYTGSFAELPNFIRAKMNFTGSAS